MQDVFLKYIAEERAKIAKQRAKLDAAEDALDQSEKHYVASGAAERNSAQKQEEELQETNQSINQSLGSFIMSNKKEIGTLIGNISYEFPINPTIKDRVVAILKKHPDGLTSRQILTTLQSTGLPSIWRETLSPQLSRLKNDDGVIDAKHGVWFLKKDLGGDDDV